MDFFFTVVFKYTGIAGHFSLVPNYCIYAFLISSGQASKRSAYLLLPSLTPIIISLRVFVRVCKRKCLVLNLVSPSYFYERILLLSHSPLKHVLMPRVREFLKRRCDIIIGFLLLSLHSSVH